MKKALGLVLGLAVTALVTVGTLFLVRQSRTLAGIAGIRPAASLNPLNQEAA